MFDSGFAPLLGILCTGYFLHTIGIPIARNARNREKIPRDFFLGYVFVCLSYVSVGAMGYIGFMSVFFKNYFKGASDGMIAQNCLNMFDFQDVPAFVLRTAIFFENPPNSVIVTGCRKLLSSPSPSPWWVA